MTFRLRQETEELKENEDIVIRSADKSAIYVILDKDYSLTKITSIL